MRCQISVFLFQIAFFIFRFITWVAIISGKTTLFFLANTWHPLSGFLINSKKMLNNSPLTVVSHFLFSILFCLFWIVFHIGIVGCQNNNSRKNHFKMPGHLSTGGFCFSTGVSLKGNTQNKPSGDLQNNFLSFNGKMIYWGWKTLKKWQNAFQTLTWNSVKNSCFFH